LFQFGDRAVDRFARSAANRYRRSGAQQIVGDRATDPSRTAGYNYFFPFEKLVHDSNGTRLRFANARL